MKRVKLFFQLLLSRRPQALLLHRASSLRLPKRSLVLGTMADRPDRRTLVKQPPLDPSKSAIENVLELTELSAIAPVRHFNSYSFIYVQTDGQ